MPWRPGNTGGGSGTIESRSCTPPLFDGLRCIVDGGFYRVVKSWCSWYCFVDSDGNFGKFFFLQSLLFSEAFTLR